MPNALVSGQRAEGPTLSVEGDKVRLYADKRYGAFETTDWVNWRDISGDVAVAQGQRHGTVFSAPAWLAEDLAKAPPPPRRWSRPFPRRRRSSKATRPIPPSAYLAIPTISIRPRTNRTGKRLISRCGRRKIWWSGRKKASSSTWPTT